MTRTKKTFSIAIKKVQYAIAIGFFGSCWFKCWTPKWHEGRGKYISVGFYFIAFYRGY